jgi:hypothetical protein
MAKFLDDNGLLYFWQKIKVTFAKQSDLDTTNHNVSSLESDISGIESLVGASSVSSQISDAIGGLDSSVNADSGKAISGLTIVNGKISGNTQINIPTNNNQLTNGAGYQTAAQVISAINSAISGITQFSFEIVSVLPASGSAGKIYLLPITRSGENGYDEYIWVNSTWEKIGTTAIDLSGYWNSTNLTAITNGDIDTIIAS